MTTSRDSHNVWQRSGAVHRWKAHSSEAERRPQVKFQASSGRAAKRTLSEPWRELLPLNIDNTWLDAPIAYLTLRQLPLLLWKCPLLCPSRSSNCFLFSYLFLLIISFTHPHPGLQLASGGGGPSIVMSPGAHSHPSDLFILPNPPLQSHPLLHQLNGERGKGSGRGREEVAEIWGARDLFQDYFPRSFMEPTGMSMQMMAPCCLSPYIANREKMKDAVGHALNTNDPAVAWQSPLS